MLNNQCELYSIVLSLEIRENIIVFYRLQTRLRGSIWKMCSAFLAVKILRDDGNSINHMSVIMQRTITQRTITRGSSCCSSSPDRNTLDAGASDLRDFNAPDSG